MRLPYLLLVAAANLAANCEVTSAAADSTLTKTVKTETLDPDEDDQDDDISGNEERGLGFTRKADDDLRKLIKQIPGGEKKIIRWKENEFSPSTLKELLGLKHTKDLQDPDTRLYKLYLAVRLRENMY
ncbi:hypothetical protein PHYBOEH_005555 [Phytophthora boehmeriae]|uniref:RxLR effector protein n=1 Tax=Phytophthora boehmeriae TaxID=109152 RepID=A0A8T1WLX5_9STRA|nr:hypothetical protein PHYBOEH_005555 [Phytophthora boehmeriae]